MKIEQFNEFVGKRKQELYDYLIKEDYNLAGEKEIEECLKNPPDFMKDGKWYYFFKKIFRNQDGDADVPCVYFDGEKLSRGADWLESGWYSYGRVVLETSEYCKCKRCEYCGKIIK